MRTTEQKEALKPENIVTWVCEQFKNHPPANNPTPEEYVSDFANDWAAEFDFYFEGRETDKFWALALPIATLIIKNG